MSSEERASEVAGFGSVLRHWRRARGLSQLELAGAAGLSTRHLSFLETGRCGPSRDAVLQLGRALDLPRPETERLLLVAGYAGDWTRRSGDRSALRRQLAKLAPCLTAHDPFPAFITDADWCVAFENRGAGALFARLRELAANEIPDGPFDLRRLLSARALARFVPELAELLEGVLAGLYQLEPDPACFGHVRPLLDVLPAAKGPGGAIERAARSCAWEHAMRVRDRGADFEIELLALPFAGGASGFALVLMRPPDGAPQDAARSYFARLARRHGLARGLPRG